MIERRPIPGFSRYMADAEGFIWSFVHATPLRLAGTLPKNKYRNRHYLVVTLYDDDRVIHRRLKVHQLVCLAFHGPAPEGKPIARHLDDKALHNAPENLAWGSCQDNSDDMVRNGGAARGKRNAATKLSDDQRVAVGALYYLYGQAAEIAKAYSISKVTVYKLRLA